MQSHERFRGEADLARAAYQAATTEEGARVAEEAMNALTMADIYTRLALRTQQELDGAKQALAQVGTLPAIARRRPVRPSDMPETEEELQARVERLEQVWQARRQAAEERAAEGRALVAQMPQITTPAANPAPPPPVTEAAGNARGRGRG